MLVTVAVQNARTAVGVHDGGDLRSCWRLATEPQRTADEWSHLVASLVGAVCAPDDVSGFAVCSAVRPGAACLTRCSTGSVPQPT